MAETTTILSSNYPPRKILKSELQVNRHILHVLYDKACCLSFLMHKMDIVPSEHKNMMGYYKKNSWLQVQFPSPAKPV